MPLLPSRSSPISVEQLMEFCQQLPPEKSAEVLPQLRRLIERGRADGFTEEEVALAALVRLAVTAGEPVP